VCCMTIHRGETITWVNDRVLHVMCFRPGPSRQPVPPPPSPSVADAGAGSAIVGGPRAMKAPRTPADRPAPVQPMLTATAERVPAG